MTDVFDPVRIGECELPNRVIMAPMTRGRSGAEGVPNDMVAEYYRQRAGAGLIISEATAVNRQGDGWYRAPGIYTGAQIDGWRKVGDAVHSAGGRIFVQLWHMGRTVLPEFAYGEQPVAPSEIAAEGTMRGKDGKPRPFVRPRALGRGEIADIVADFVEAARNARAAGIDGVEVHAANNFLIDSFLRDGTNVRTDEYGGSAENRARFLLEIVEGIGAAIGFGRTGVRVSPTNRVFGISDSNPQHTFVTVAGLLNRLSPAYLHVLEPPEGADHPMATELMNTAPAIRNAFEGPLILNGGFDLNSANSAVGNEKCEAVAIGVPFIANPDLVDRWRSGLPLATPDPELFYTDGAEGYVDYPASDVVHEAEPV